MSRRKKVTPDDSLFNQASVKPNRRVEIVGIMVMVIFMLIAISIVTYNESDYVIVSDAGIENVLPVDNVTSMRVKNGLGMIGAYLSHTFVYLFLGYSSIIVCMVGFQYGWAIFRHHSLESLRWSSFLWITGMVLVATSVGWLSTQTQTDLETFSGTLGIVIAQIMLNLTGTVGSAILLISFTMVFLLLLVDRDVQLTIDRIKDTIRRFKDWVEVKSEERREKREERRDEREATKEQKEIESASKEQKSTIKIASDTSFESVLPERKRMYTVRIQGSKPEHSQEAATELDTDIKPEGKLSTRERWLREQEAMKEKIMPDRALLNDPNEAATRVGYEDEIALTVSVGEEEEAAKARDLEREQRALSIPQIRYQFPTIDLLDNPPADGNEVDFDEIEENKDIIMSKLRMHGIEIVAVEAIVGPTVTLYELQPAPDVKISKIESYANDLKMAMATRGLRIIAPIPGKSAVGIEVPNRKRQTVYIKQLINTRKFVETKMALPVAFGKTIENEVYMVDLTTMPHLLIAGATGSGKSVGINTILTCLLYKCHPENLKFVLIDPKKIELSLYRYLQKHFIATLPDAEEPIITDTSKVMETLTSVTKEMDERYELLKMGMVRDIRAYNDKFREGKLEIDLGHRHLPYIVVIIDELADLMLTAGKAIEEPIARIAQLARAVGIHLVVATQRPSVNVITGTIKANFPVRIAYQVASKIDSRTILDTMGADQLVGKGDMLVSTGGHMIRVQNAFVSTEEVEKINAFIGNQLGYNKPYYLPKVEDPNSSDSGVPDLDDRDDLFEEAAKVVVLHQQGSVSLIQRKLKLGYNRAGRIIDQLYAAGIVGPYQGSTARDVLIADEDELYEHLRNLDES
jgi:S-DNA-T family DNA segregation ATPase FtsK/SpoIIIE